MTGGERARPDELTHRSRGTLEGLLGGAATGAWLAWVERSPVWNKFADVLNAGFRVLDGFVSDTVWTRLDTESAALVVYIAAPALFGAAVGALAGRLRTGVRILVIVLAIAIAELAVLWPLWHHRELPLELGAGTIALGALLTAAVAILTGVVTSHTPRAATTFAARALVAFVAIVSIATIVFALRAPARPDGVIVDEVERIDTAETVAILAFDGLEWRLIDEAIAGGRLPHFAELISRGVRGKLRSIRPPKSPVVWTSVATGMLPSAHGIRDFVARRDGVSVPVTGNVRRVPALWDLGAVAGYTVAFVDWYVTWPAEPVRGLLVSDRVDYEGLDRRVFPEEFTAAVDSARARAESRIDRDASRFLDGDDIASWRARQWGQIDRSLRVLDEVVRHDLVTLEIGRTALRAGQPDLTAFYFRGNDNTQHLFWKYRLAQSIGPTTTDDLFDELEPDDTRRLAPVIDRYYDFADRLLGESLELLDPNTAVLVVSDHGFLTRNELGTWTHGNAFLAELGLATLFPNTGGDVDSAASRVVDESPPTTNLAHVFRPGGKGDAGALEGARELLADVRTISGTTILRTIVPGEDERGPFLRVEFRAHIDGDSCVAREIRFPVNRFRTREAKSGDHRMDGVLIAAGPPFPRGGEIAGARAVDVAPTVLHLLGAPAGRDMEGVVLVDLFESAWRKTHPVRYVASYGTREDATEDAISSDVDEQIREELRALGYIQ